VSGVGPSVAVSTRLEPMEGPRTGGSAGDLALPRGGVRLKGPNIVRAGPGRIDAETFIFYCKMFGGTGRVMFNSL
jgi:hypothetical protein